MTALDIIVLFLLGSGAVFGFLRGFVQEALSMIAWVLIILAVYMFHTPATAALAEAVGSDSGAAVLAFLALVIVIFAVGKWIAKSIGAKSRKSLLGPIDRVLGFGFGMLKGLIIATLFFLLFVMGYDLVYGADTGRPEWMTSSRTYPLLNASGEAMSEFVREQRLAADSDAETVN
ncbi:CvpA family protein [Sphingorhabdus sp.]|jgi:membrane protein required for colicin V production|uniref:CvpA family protein n=1 Tax=Sphingorhabdus sp. TaxID=1902408 RepID=UPI0037C864B1